MNNGCFLISKDKTEIAETIEIELLKSLREDSPQSLNTSVVLSARDANDRIIGGLTASTSYSWLLVKTLWVDQQHRHSGIGRSLMQRGEDEGRILGCHSAWLDTSSTDAMRFYLNFGYEVFGEISNTEQQYPPNHHRWFMKKLLSETGVK